MAHIQSITITSDGDCTATVISSNTGDTITITIPGDVLEGRSIDDRWAIIRERAERHIAAITGASIPGDRRQPIPFVYRGKVYPIRQVTYQDPQRPFSGTKCARICEDGLWKMLAADATFFDLPDISEAAQRELDTMPFFTKCSLFDKDAQIIRDLQTTYPHYIFEKLK